MKRITITIEPDDYAPMTRVAKNNDVTVSWLMRRPVREFLERQEREGSFRLEIDRPGRTAADGT